MHPKYGLVDLYALRGRFEVTLEHHDGKFAGSLDPDQGGGLSHPNQSVQQFIDGLPGKPALLDLDYEGYCKLEDLLEAEIRELWPDFFSQPSFDRPTTR
jgi:hypothetical protein